MLAYQLDGEYYILMTITTHKKLYKNTSFFFSVLIYRTKNIYIQRNNAITAAVLYDLVAG
jgi:hypothetical protein